MRDQNPSQHKTVFELEREARIAENKQRLASLGLEGAADALRKTLDQDKAIKHAACKKKKQRPRMKVAGEVRRSERVQKLPAVDYNRDLLVVERLARQELRDANSSGRSVRRVLSRAYDGLKPVLDVRNNPVAAWQAAPAGWKEALGCAGVEAAEAARAAAVVLAERLSSKGRAAFVKSMTFSQVASGFWSAVPQGLGAYYGNTKRDLFMISDNQAHRSPDSFVKLWRQDDVQDAVRWRVVYLPRPSQDYGWSGGWRSFAIDHMLSPNDTVVFEVMDNAEGEAEVERMKAAAAAAETAAAAAAGGGGGGDEQEAGRGSSPAGAAASSGASCEGAAAAAAGQEGEGEQQQQPADSAAAVGAAAAAAAGSKAGAVYKGDPGKREYVRAYVFRASAYESKEEMDRRREAAAARAAAAAAELQKQQQQEEEQQEEEEEEKEKQTDSGEEDATGASGSCGAAAGVGAAAAGGGGEGAGGRGSRKRKSAGGGTGAQQQQQQQQEKRSRGKQQTAAGAAEAGPAEAGVARKRQRAQQQEGQQEEVREAEASGGKQGSRKKPKAAAPAAAGGGKKGAAGGAGAGGAGSSGKQRAQAGWVPQPADPSVLVPPPTADEVRRNETASNFVVDRIVAHKVVKGKDEFLIRWEGFGAYWDSWEGSGCLNAPAAAYTWQGGKAAIPAKFLQKQSKK